MQRRSPDPPLGPTLALTLVLAAAGFALLVGLAELVVHPQRLAPPFDLGENQHTETALYVASFVVLLPLALVAGLRAARRDLTGPAPVLAGLLALALLLARAIDSAGALVAAFVVWWALAAALLWWDSRRPLPTLSSKPAWWLSGGLLLATLLAFTSLDSIDPVALVLLGVLAAASLAGYERIQGRLRLGRWGPPLDAAAVLALLVLVPNLALFAGQTPQDQFAAYVAKTHQNFLLGPANVVAHGGALLVDAASQYGIGSVYLLSGWFQVAPIGYGTFGLLGALLMVGLLGAGFCLLRACGTPRPLALAALALAVVALVYNLRYRMGSLPQDGPLRFGLPLLAVLAAALEARWPARPRAARAGQLATLGLASVWSFEALALTAATLAAVTGLRAWELPPVERPRWLARRAALAIAACAVAQLVLVALTLVLSGDLPDYGWYFAFLREFLVGDIGNITYDFARWSPGLPVGAGYAASLVALALVLRLRPDVARREPVVVTALAGVSAYGALLFGYLVDRSLNEIVPYVSFPLLLLGCLWLTLVLRVGPPAAARAALGFALAAAVLVASTAWSSVPDRFADTPLARAAPGGAPLRADLRRLWRLPPTDPRIPQGERLVERYLPSGGKALTLLPPALEAELLVRTGRTSALDMSYPSEDSFIPGRRRPAVERAVDRIRPGSRLLTQAGVLRPGRASEPLAPLQREALRRIRQRFRLRVIHLDRQGYAVVVLSA